MTVPPTDESSGSLDRGGSTPLYIQLANVLRDKIERGEWKPDQKIPSENELNRPWTFRRRSRTVLRPGSLWRAPGTAPESAPATHGDDPVLADVDAGPVQRGRRRLAQIRHHGGGLGLGLVVLDDHGVIGTSAETPSSLSR